MIEWEVRVSQDLFIVKDSKLVVDSKNPNYAVECAGSIIIKDPGLTEMPSIIYINGDLIAARSNIVTIPPGLRVSGFMDVSGCEALRTIFADLAVDIQLQINGCDNLEPLPNLSQVECVLSSGFTFWPRKKQIIVYGLAIDSDDKDRRLGRTFNDMFGIDLYAKMPDTQNSPSATSLETSLESEIPGSDLGIVTRVEGGKGV